MANTLKPENKWKVVHKTDGNFYVVEDTDKRPRKMLGFARTREAATAVALAGHGDWDTPDFVPCNN